MKPRHYEYKDASLCLKANTSYGFFTKVDRRITCKWCLKKLQGILIADRVTDGLFFNLFICDNCKFKSIDLLEVIKHKKNECTLLKMPQKHH